VTDIREHVVLDLAEVNFIDSMGLRLPLTHHGAERQLWRACSWVGA